MKNNVALIILLAFFLGLGVILPYIENDFGQDTSEYDTAGIVDDLSQTRPGNFYETVTTWDILVSIATTLIFWSFNVPWAINLFLLWPLRVWMLLIVWDKVRGI